MKTYAHRAVVGIVFVFVIAFCNSSSAQTNTITRKIYSEKGTIFVEDNFHLRNSIWRNRRILSDIYSARLEKGTNILKAAKKFLSKEEVEVVECNIWTNASFTHLQIVSKVNNTYPIPAKIKCFARFGYTLPMSGKPAEPFLEIYGGRDAQLVWMPELDTPTNLVETVKAVHDLEYFMHDFMGEQLKREDRDIFHLKCSLVGESHEETLFEEVLGDDTPGIPSDEFLSAIQRAHPMSCNDWLRIFTHIKPAKPGYYSLDLSGATNRAPFFPNGKTNFTTQPWTQKEINEFKDYISGKDPKASSN